MAQFKIIGYYICKIIDTPIWLSGIGKQALSVSGCIGEQHPDPKCFMGGWRKKESQRYQNYLKLNNEQYKDFSNEAIRLFNLKQIDVDGRFVQASDAQNFHKRFRLGNTFPIVSLSTTPKYFEILAKELNGSNSYGLMNGSADNSLWIGNDMLGWDIAGFHSFLCNSLQNGLSGAKFNNRGLLANQFHDVIRYAEQIQGLGEPVEWLPCRLGILTPFENL